MRRGCKRRKRRRASATRGRRHAESTALAKLASRGRQPVSLPIRPAPRSDHRLRGRLEMVVYRQRKERESCATLTISRAPVISASRRPSIASSGSITGAACITTCTNTFARVIRASAIRSIRLVRVDLWGDALSSVRGP
ncbi:unnamed protein product [Trichogramma brassicae]|uniref:Uncharacterized protein n=1 Tax=Trichogramma brassicae TaxID=86971 RepID=A0A6H5J184_9HYME|nr:unnamed protein product [Trichogramma brassicae]